jgi:BirA family biotin operon repressor/biotin-[acetyl-CoA-carboxylase] ligase
VCLSETLSGGLGRRGRLWIAPLGGAICLSVAYRFEQLPRDIGALSLAVGACALQVLQNEGLGDVRLKWPNDLLARGRKLGGILIELRAEAGGPTHVVIGIGLNVSLGEAARSAVRRLGAAATDLTELGLADPLRNRLAAALIGALIEGIAQFEAQGFAPFRARWHDADALLGLAVDVTGAGVAQRGVARGINRQGELQLDTPAGRISILAGDVSVRAEQGA